MVEGWKKVRGCGLKETREKIKVGATRSEETQSG
jgi:hypothetical protein